jgi:hypothetical protein
MYVIAFVLLLIAAAVFTFEFVKASFAPYSMLAFGLQALALALILYKATNELDGVFK